MFEARDEAAIMRAFLPYARALARTLAAAARVDADEVEAEVGAVLVDRVRSFDLGRSVRFATHLRWGIQTVCRKLQRQAGRIVFIGDGVAGLVARDEPDAKDAGRRLRACLDLVTDAQRQVILARLHDSDPGLRPQQVRSRWRRACERIRRRTESR
ncbi:hypothetical protein [Nannocystis bainbridge]|uniref:RNA polymerase sigma-70 region 2 domain-containing protein n=1 Tax=Nannocystis bainbridge TaxID=2995303 RepID=A0ABT5E4M9_9BACT|nr:hypothetical protein [Nannocystis bainbridge]MDC0720690.1 hypothetical protein [Nannocystis bainbridge]